VGVKGPLSIARLLRRDVNTATSRTCTYYVRCTAMQLWAEMAETMDADWVYESLAEFAKQLDELKEQLMDREMLLVDQIEVYTDGWPLILREIK